MKDSIVQTFSPQSRAKLSSIGVRSALDTQAYVMSIYFEAPPRHLALFQLPCALPLLRRQAFFASPASLPPAIVAAQPTASSTDGLEYLFDESMRHLDAPQINCGVISPELLQFPHFTDIYPSKPFPLVVKPCLRARALPTEPRCAARPYRPGLGSEPLAHLYTSSWNSTPLPRRFSNCKWSTISRGHALTICPSHAS